MSNDKVQAIASEKPYSKWIADGSDELTFPKNAIGVSDRNATAKDIASNCAGWLICMCHGVAAESGWWTDLKTGESLIGKRNVGELLCLVHSEISEAMEGHRKDLQDDKLPHRKMFEVELADTLIRIFDLAGAMKLDLGGAIYEKLRYNINRADHKPENRVAENGKKY